MVDIYEMEKSQKTGKWKTQQNKLLAISMPFEHATAMFKQRGILAPEYKFKTLYKELNGVFPAHIRAIAIMHGNLYALADHDEEKHRYHPEPELFVHPFKEVKMSSITLNTSRLHSEIFYMLVELDRHIGNKQKTKTIIRDYFKLFRFIQTKK